MRFDLKRILCPVDFSAASGHAMRYAVALAENFAAELVLLHVAELPAIDIAEYYGLPGADFSFAAIPVRREVDAQPGSTGRDTEDELDKAASELRESHTCRITTRRRIGAGYLEIIHAARDEGVDLIVMGTHGRTGLSHVLMGSTAEKVVRMAPCPVLTVKHPQHEFVMP